uniref:tripartite tricarboxylate transporter permease n=1 Tax=Hydrogenophaga sp. TaxID=1904254 RepID=UPI0035656EF1
AIVLNTPGEPSSVMTSLDGHPLALQGRAGAALSVATLSSFLAGCMGIGLVAALAPWVVELGFHFGPAEYTALLVLALVGATVLASGSFLKALGMTVLGLLMGLVGWDAITGTVRFVPEALEPWLGRHNGLTDGVAFIALALGFFVVAPVIAEMAGQSRSVATVDASASSLAGLDGPATASPGFTESPMSPMSHPAALADAPALVAGLHTRPTRAELRDCLPALWRGTGLGALLGILPGGGALLASLAAYNLERFVSRKRTPALGSGHLRGVAAPEAANNAGAQTAYLPLLTLGIPPNAAMALLLGAMVLHHVEPGPQLMAVHPDLFWGLIVAMWMGNLLLLLLNLPLTRFWTPALLQVLKLPRAAILVALLVAAALGALALGPHGWGVWLVMAMGALGYVFNRLGCEAVALLLGFVLAPAMEEQLRRSLQFSRGNWLVFLERPISAALLLLSVFLLLVVVLPTVRRNTGH